MTQHGFKVIEMPDLPSDSKQFSWRVVHPFDWTIEHHPNCPIDGTPMEIIAALVSLTTDELVRCGCCPRCGLVGYIDRPSEADIDRYYAETWMGQSTDEAIEIARSVAMSAPRQRDMDVLASLHIDRSLPVLEIGCGYGGTIHALRKAGFADIDATEHCPARAEAVRRVFDIRVTTEIPQKRYGLIISHHVLEHCADPAGLIRACAERQEPGDWMIHSLPLFDEEPSVGVLLFLPHLWSFGITAMRSLLESCGYGDTNCGQGCGMNLHFTAVRGGEVLSCSYAAGIQSRLDKLLRGLGLTPQRSQLYWQRDSDGAAWKSLSYVQQAAVSNFPRSMVVEPVTEFVTDAPIELQFQNRVEMFVK